MSIESTRLKGAASQIWHRFKLMVPNKEAILAKRQRQLEFNSAPPWLQKHTKMKWIRLNANINTLKKEITHSDKPILVGPWISEVGYEVLYWVPFLNWFFKDLSISRDRIWCFSRGGTNCWYEEFTDQYTDAFEFFSAEDYLNRIEDRWKEKNGGQKQNSICKFDQNLYDLACKKKSWDNPHWIHPSLMYAHLKHFWKGRTGSNWIENFTEFTPYNTDGMQEERKNLNLPTEYYAVKIYFNPSFPKTDENINFCNKLILRLTQKAPVVLLNTGLKIDDHDELGQRIDSDRVIYIADKFTTSRNLWQQTAVLAGAKSFWGTYGGFSYIGPFVNIPSYSFYSSPDHFFPEHLNLAQLAVNSLLRKGMTKSSFTAVDTKDLNLFFDMSTNSQELS